MASFSLEIDDRSEEEREKEKAMREHYQANKKKDSPMDTELQEDLGFLGPKIRIKPEFAK